MVRMSQDGESQENLPVGRVSREVEHVALVVQASLREAKNVHDALGQGGATVAGVNRFGEKALKCDIDCESAILQGLEKAGLHGKAVTEEHGEVQIGSRSDFTFVIDGLDGTAQYKKGPGSPSNRYGTMVSVLQGEDPTFGDYLVTALGEHARHQIYIAKRGGGTWKLTPNGDLQVSLRPCPSLGEVQRGYVDRWFDINRTVFDKNLPGITLEYHLATSYYYASLLDDRGQIVLECTRKSNLELATAYALVREAGGVLCDIRGGDMGVRKYFALAKDAGKPLVTIACASQALADEIGKICLPEYEKYKST